jgi:hypothetical protein
VADRQNAKLLAIGGDGTSTEFATFSEGDAPGRHLRPDTEATRRAGIAGDLFIILIRRGTFTLNEIVRVSGRSIHSSARVCPRPAEPHTEGGSPCAPPRDSASSRPRGP